jgi:GR25 family glycosyltransferase involved in LPS biosynthesis
MLKKPNIIYNMCLNMIVKNEAHIISETLESVYKYIDYWVICDTGSTDGTQQIIQNFFKNKNIAGELYEEPWKNFAYNRTYALQKAYKKSKYLWIIDADDIVNGNLVFPINMTSDSYYLTYGPSIIYIRTQVVNNQLEWVFKGVLHEFIERKNKEKYSVDLIKGDYYIESRRLGSRNKNPQKYLDDAIILIKAIEEEPELAARYSFYAGQSYRDYGDLVNAIRYYSKRIEYGGWTEEVYLSHMEIGNAMIILKYGKEAIIEIFMQGFRVIPDRYECLYYLTQYHYTNNDIERAFKVGTVLLNIKSKIDYSLFVQEDIKKWKMYVLMYDIYEKMDEQRIVYPNEKKEQLIKYLNESNDVPLEIKNKLNYKKLPIIDSEQIDKLSNFIFLPNVDSYSNDIGYFPNKTIDELNDICNMFDDAIAFNTYGYIKNKINDVLIRLEPLKYQNEGIFILKKFVIEKTTENEKIIDYEKYIDYNEELINKISENIKIKKKNGITLTITTCKRYDLFEKTINSFINCCEDIMMIDRFIGIDDNSSTEDRNNMLNKYPFIEWIFKSEYSKGHLKSMNMIIDLVDSEYLIHLEDDWLFYEQMDYISKALNILNQDKVIAIDNIPNNQNINIKQIKQVLFNKNYIEIDTQVIDGGYRCKTSDGFNYIIHEHFNDTLDIKNYNYACTKVNGPNCIYWPHYSFRPSVIKTDIFKTIGKYNSESSFFEREYADRYYDNNFISSFFDKVTCRHIGKLTSEKGDNAYTLNNEKQFSITEKSSTEPSEKQFNKKTYCLNLERRQDRKDYMIELFKNKEINDYQFYKAIDGQQLKLSYFIYNLFRNNDFNYRKGFIGCALSHYYIWKELIDSEYDFFIVYEDDINFTDNYKQKLDKVLKSVDFTECDYLLLGYHMFKNKREQYKDIYDVIKEDTEVYKLNRELYIGSAFSYIITKTGASKILKYIDENGIKHGIDYVIGIIPNLNIYETQPQLCFSEWVDKLSSNVDSDIQKNFDIFDFNKIISEIKSNYHLYQYLDCPGNDSLFFDVKSKKDLFLLSLENPYNIAFNTLGFFKNKVDINKLEPTKYYYTIRDGFDLTDDQREGIFVHKNEIERQKKNRKQINIKMICNWTSSEALCNDWSNLMKEKYRWNNLNFTWSDDNIDYYVIINKTDYQYYDPKKTIIFHMEPWCYNNNQNWGVKTWGVWADPDPSSFLHVRTHKRFYNNGFWQLKQTWSEFKNNQIIKDSTKENRISTICSSKYFDPGHIKRINFLKFVEQQNDPNVIIDIYNHDNQHNFKNHIGPHPPDNKDVGITPYKYYFMGENNEEFNFMTEKIWEPLLTESLCFYWGCPNLSDYIDPLAYVQLDLNDFQKSFNIIKNAIENNLWEQRLEVIRKEKQKVLNYYGFCPTVERVIESHLEYKQYFGELSDMKFKTVCFIHSCTIDNNISMLKYLLNKVISSKLIDKLDLIVINNVGDNIGISNLDLSDDYVKKLHLINYSTNPLFFEIPTINLIHSFSQFNQNVKVLYLHTKGNSYKELSQLICDWIDLLVYFNIDKHDICLKELDDYDCIGCNYYLTPEKHFSGNFWWSKTDYICKLDRIDKLIRHYAEFWLCRNKYAKIKSIHNSNTNHYYVRYPPENYITPI